jgi:putative transposase
MIERDGEISVKRQAQLLDLSRSSVYYVARDLPERDLRLMRILDELHLKWPFYGARKLTRELQNQGHEVGRRHVTTLMRRMGMETIYRKPRTSIPAPLSAVYPYLLNGLKIERPNHVWAADLTYVPMAHGFQYLVAIIDVGSRKTLSWRVSNTMTPDFCVEALQEALGKYGKPEIFNTDQGSQFTSGEWIDTLKAAGVQISMDGKGRWIDNVFIERLWRSVKYENIYLHAYESGTQLRRGLTEYFDFYNAQAHAPGIGLSDPGRCLLWPCRVQARGMIGVTAARSEELLPLRGRLRVVGTIDEETDRRDHQQGWQIHLAHQEICPKNRSHPLLERGTPASNLS